jgi:hypothetical protein
MTRRIRIDRVVLENVPQAQRAALLRAFRAGLANPQPGAAPALLPAPASGAEAGRRAAQAVTRRIGGGS